MTIFVSDFEVTTSNKGNPFDKTNIPVLLGFKLTGGNLTVFTYDFINNTNSFGLNTLKNIVNDNHEYLVFFNAKFDLHWYRKCGVSIGTNRIWCCQLAEFILGGQSKPYPSLEETAVKYELGHKVDIVKTEYWDKGIDTDEIPTDILKTYVKQDVELTYQIYLKQLEQFKQNEKLFKLFKLQCQDLLILEEMEWNGITYDHELCVKRHEELKEKELKLLDVLNSVYPNISINFSSTDQLSAFLYGGKIIENGKEHIGFYKTGIKAGQPKYKNIEIVHELPRLIEPLPKTELKKEGVWSTDENTLRKLKGPNAKKYVDVLLELSKIEKLINTYYVGIPAINEKMNWPIYKIYGQFNQCVTSTGRLSSSKPNLQNFAGDCLDIFVSNYD